MKNYLFLFTFLSVFVTAQTNRFYYDYKYISDSTNKADVKSDIMLLDIDKNGSKYYSREKFVSDSATKADIAKQMKGGFGTSINIKKNIKPGVIYTSVTKVYPDYKVSLSEKIGNTTYKIAEDQKPEWKILPDKQKIGEYNTQKATTTYGGREWTAWFSTDIPFQDGPYKFYGLPGLIVKLEDKTGSHIMTLIGNKKTEASSEEELQMPGVTMIGLGGKDIEVTKKQFKKAWKDYQTDPTKDMKQTMSTLPAGAVVKMKNQDGKDIDMNEMYRNIEKRAREEIQKNNNKIEPDLYK
ncbi:GLPGLI family protein [Chryseobacterium soldanellicola]|uniref:GLPGLI family protein n=1 Tax=Chryseobacterium soldanellicola TaxID=311333 RepID=A0A1H1FYR1_9FLAO|nr:GLPGLI family protein [Chryseobacterium soldanellicola]SDR06083.1 GLPGLI family protein [Chryseobacterium soldanellicola]